jgi:D-arabinonate dehydratase
MKISQVKAIPVRMPLAHVFPGSTYEIRERCTIITEIHTDEGHVGRTFLGDNRDTQSHVLKVITDLLTPSIIGEDLFFIERCWHKMFDMTLKQGNRKEIAEAIGAIDTALWDLRGKICNQPVFKLLGGYTDKLQPIVTGGYYTEKNDHGELIDEALQIKENGYAGAKLKVGGLSPLEDAKRIQAVRSAIGDHFLIAVDANQGWSRHEATEFGLAVRELNLAWFEEPVHWYDEIQGMKYVRQQTGIKVCAGQSEFSYRGCRELVEGEAVDILNFDVSIGGGVTEWIRIARMAETFQIYMTHHEEPLISMHLMGSIKGGLHPEYFMEARDPLTPILVTDAPKIENGWLKISDTPGFGLKFNEDVINKYKVNY